MHVSKWEKIQKLLRDIEVFAVSHKCYSPQTSSVLNHYLATTPVFFLSPRPSKPLEPFQFGFQLFLSFSKFISLLRQSLVLVFQISDTFFSPL